MWGVTSSIRKSLINGLNSKVEGVERSVIFKIGVEFWEVDGVFFFEGRPIKF